MGTAKRSSSARRFSCRWPWRETASASVRKAHRETEPLEQRPTRAPVPAGSEAQVLGQRRTPPGGRGRRLRRAGRGRTSRSTACATVWPAFRIARRPPSRSSPPTTSALISTLRRTRISSAGGSRAEQPLRLALDPAEIAGIGDEPVLHRFREPAPVLALGEARQRGGSAITATGGWNAPIRFLPCGVSTPVLPPTEASSIARRRGGHQHERNAAMVGRRDEPGEVAHDAATQATMQMSRPKPRRSSSSVRLAHVSRVFDLLARWKLMVSPIPRRRVAEPALRG